METNRRLKNLERSEIRIMSVECEKVNGINMAQGICDLKLPPGLARGAKAAIDGGVNQYTRFDGLSSLRRAISEKLSKFNRISADPEKNIVVTCGSTGALYSACLALFNPGDEVLLFEPFYGYHEYTLLALDLTPVYVRLSPPGWRVDFDLLEKKVSGKTRAIIINTPANPTGKVLSREELQMIADFCVRHDLLILTDEIYEYIVYDGGEHISPGSMPEIKDRVVTISGFSKTFSITGWRIGYSASDERFCTRIGCASDLVYVCAPAPLQEGVAETVFSLPDEYYGELKRSFEAKRDKFCEALCKAGLTPYVPEGAYYVLADCENLPGSDSKEKAMYLLGKTGVAGVPGGAFYREGGGESLIRFCYAKSDAALNEACERLLILK